MDVCLAGGGHMPRLFHIRRNQHMETFAPKRVRGEGLQADLILDNQDSGVVD